MIPQPIDQVPLFLKLTEEERELITSRLRHLEFNTRDVIFTANRPAEFFGVIVKGWVQLESDTPQGRIALANLGAGSVIGEVDLLLNRPHSTSAHAASTTNLLALYRQDLQEIILECPTIGLKFSSSLGTRVAYLDEYLATQRLSAVPLLSSLSDEEMRAMASQLEYRTFQRGETLFEAGSAGEAIYLIEEGTVRLISSSRDGDSFDEFTEGDLIGHTALITGKPLASTARAVSDLNVWILHRSDYQQLISAHPTIKVAFSRALAEGLDSADQDKAITQLQALPLFADVDEEALQGIARSLVLRHFPAGELIYAEGTPGDAMYFVEWGDVRLASDAASEAELLDRKHAGEFFGEMALLTGRTRAEAAKAHTDATLWVLYKTDYDDLMVEHPSLSLALSRALSGRLMSAEGQSVERHLHGIKLFAGLSQAELKEIGASVKPLRFRPGETICQAGQPAQYLYLIETGEVREIAGVNGRAAVVNLLGAQQSFGERAVFQNSAYPTTMQAVGEVDCWTLAKPDFDQAMSRYSALALNVARHIAEDADRSPVRQPRPVMPLPTRPNGSARPAPAYVSAPIYANAPQPPAPRAPTPPRAPVRAQPTPVAPSAAAVGVRSMPGKPWERPSSTVLRPMPAANSRPIAMNGTAPLPVPAAPYMRRANNTGTAFSTRISTMSTGGKIKLAIVGLGVPLVALVVLLLVAVTILSQVANFGGFSGAPPSRDLPANMDDPSAPAVQMGFIQNTGKMAMKVRTATPTPVPPTAVPPTVKPAAKPTKKPVVASAPKPALAAAEAPAATAVAEAAAVVRPPLPPREWDSRLGGGGLPLLLGVGVTEAKTQPGQQYWRLVRMKFQDAGAESGNDHTIYVSIIDEKGQRLEDQSAIVSWDEGGAVQIQRLGFTDQKPKGDYCNCNYNWPMYGAGYRVKVDGTLPSDEAYGMIMPEHRHVNYLLTFQRVVMP